MKLPRWLVILLLSSSLLAVLAAGGWWWVIWPERTAREFEFLIEHRIRDEATAMILSSDYPAGTIVAWLTYAEPPESKLQQLPRSWGDVCLGRGQYRIGDNRRARFVTEKGRVTRLNTWADIPLDRPAR